MIAPLENTLNVRSSLMITCLNCHKCHVFSSLWSNVSKVTSLCGRSLNQWVSDSHLLSCSGQLKTKKRINYILVIVASIFWPSVPQGSHSLCSSTGDPGGSWRGLKGNKVWWIRLNYVPKYHRNKAIQFNSISHDDLLSNRSIRSRSQWLMICGRGTKCVIETSEFHLTVWGAWVEWEMSKSIMLQNDSFVLNKNIRLGIHTPSRLIPVVIVEYNDGLLCAF